MFSSISTHQPPSLISDLRKFLNLQQEFQSCAQQGSLPPTETRIQLKIIEQRLPSNLINYINLVAKYSESNLDKVLATIPQSSSCEIGDSLDEK